MDKNCYVLFAKLSKYSFFSKIQLVIVNAAF